MTKTSAKPHVSDVPVCSKMLKSDAIQAEIEQIRASLLTIPEFATATRITVRHCHRMWAEGIGPRQTRLGGKVFVRVDEMGRWLKERTQVVGA